MHATAIGHLSAARGWTRTQLISELRRVAREREIQLPGDESLKRMIREWANGHRGLSDFYADLFAAVFGVAFASSPVHGHESESFTAADSLVTDELAARLAAAAGIDAGLIRLFEDQTQSLRLLDRRLGARGILPQTEAHMTEITDLLAYTTRPGLREPLAAAAAEVAALAGWQALDLGDPDKAWRHHELAKSVAREAGNEAVLAHVTAQQGYALIDLNQGVRAVELMKNALSLAGQVPSVLRSWLWAAVAEAHASIGDALASCRALDEAHRLLQDEGVDPELPFVVLDQTHFRRWRGHCLARLGDAEAVDELTAALETLDPSFARAAAALYCDLALAHSKRGEHDAAHAAAQKAAELATRTTSVRQQRRLSRLLQSAERPAR